MRFRTIGLLTTLAITAVGTTGCSDLIAKLGAALEEEYEGVVRERAREAAPGQIPDEPPVIEPDPIVVNSILPNRSETTGGLLVEIVGLGFEEGMTVWFGTIPVPETDTDVLTETRILVVTPASPIGVVNVGVAESETRFGLLELGFEFYEPVTVTSVTPDRGSSLGGEQVIVEGTGFVEGTQVRFGTGTALDPSIVDSGKLVVVTPRLPRDVYAVTVSNQNGTETLTGAYATFDPVRVRQVVPYAGPLGGGTVITVIGTGFIAPANLEFGTQTALPGPTSSSDETELYANTPPAVPVVEGAVDVSVTVQEPVSGNMVTSTLTNGFVYYDETDTSPRVIAVTPSTGLIDGGTEIRVVGTGLDDPSTVVEIGGVPASCTVVDDHMVTCTTPPAPEGVVDVRVVNSTVDETIVGGFQYIELRIDGLLHNFGAIAGGTWVQLYGNGFGAITDVFFDDIPARNIEVESWTKVNLRTPPGAVGSVAIRIETQGVEITEPDRFTYFQPYDGAFFSSGPPIEGTVNITVLDADTNQGLQGAFVILEADSTTEYAGFTNKDGQITLSGPWAEVDGPITVTSGKPGYALFSWTGVDARDLIMLQIPIPDPSPPSMGPGAPPAIIRGEVIRIKDEYNFGDDLVLVTTTYASFSVPLPDPGPKAQMINQGSYELWARGGDMVVLALAGTVTLDNRLKVHAMGFAPFVSTEVGSGEMCNVDDDCPSGEQCYAFDVQSRACTHVYEGVDIVVDTPLKQQLRIELDDPPLFDPMNPSFNVPNTTAAFIWYDFGSRGLHPMADPIIPGADVILVDMPLSLPGDLEFTPFNAVVGVYLGYDADNDPNTPVELYPPQSEVRIFDLFDTTQIVVATPMLGTQTEIDPNLYGTVGDPMHFQFSVNRPVIPAANMHTMYYAAGMSPVLYWLALSPGVSHEFELPVFPAEAADALPPPGLYYWQMMGMWSEGVVYNHLDINKLFAWHSRSAYVSVYESIE